MNSVIRHCFYRNKRIKKYKVTCESLYINLYWDYLRKIEIEIDFEGVPI